MAIKKELLKATKKATEVVETETTQESNNSLTLEAIIVAKDKLAYTKVYGRTPEGAPVEYKATVTETTYDKGTLSGLSAIVALIKKFLEKKLGGVLKIYTLGNIANGIDLAKYRLANGGFNLKGEAIDTEEVKAWEAFMKLYQENFMNLHIVTTKEIDSSNRFARKDRHGRNLAKVVSEGWKQVGATKEATETVSRYVDEAF